MATVFSYAGTQNDYTSMTGGTNATTNAMRFTVSATCLLTSVNADWKKTGSPADNLVTKVYNDSSGHPGTSLETGSAIAGSSLSTSYGAATSTFAGTTQLNTSTTYWIVWTRSGGNDGTNYYDIALDTGATGDFIFTTVWVDISESAVNVAVQGNEPTAGPANLKTWDGLVKASVKTINGLAIASVKTVNGLA